MQSGTCFIGCSKSKKGFPCMAKEMYQGTLFKKSLLFAQSNYENVFILSAKYGILSLDTLINPYDKTLSKMPKKEYQDWIMKIEVELQDSKYKKPFTFLTGSLYHKHFEGIKPLSGMPIGKMLQYFNQNKLTNTFFK